VSRSNSGRYAVSIRISILCPRYPSKTVYLEPFQFKCSGCHCTRTALGESAVRRAKGVERHGTLARSTPAPCCVAPLRAPCASVRSPSTSAQSGGVRCHPTPIRFNWKCSSMHTSHTPQYCPQCSYDLHGLFDKQLRITCPECGTVVEESWAKAIHPLPRWLWLVGAITIVACVGVSVSVCAIGHDKYGLPSARLGGIVWCLAMVVAPMVVCACYAIYRLRNPSDVRSETTMIGIVAAFVYGASLQFGLFVVIWYFIILGVFGRDGNI